MRVERIVQSFKITSLLVHPTPYFCPFSKFILSRSILKLSSTCYDFFLQCRLLLVSVRGQDIGEDEGVQEGANSCLTDESDAGVEEYYPGKG